MSLVLRRPGPQITVQDLGRPGYLAKGLSRGGAADRLALFEAAVLLDQTPGLGALEMAGAGGVFEATRACRIALTGAPMAATLGDKPVPWNVSLRMAKGDVLSIGPAKSGTFGYLSVGGGFDTPLILGSRAAHLVVGIGARLEAGAELPFGDDPGADRPPMKLEVADRTRGGVARVVPGAQTAFYAEETRARLETTEFTRGDRGNRQGVMLTFDGAPFEAEGQRTILSEIIIPGDVQMTGDGRPFVLLTESQTTGGYPRIGSVHPEDLPMVAQAAPGAKLRFSWVTHEEAAAALRSETTILKDLKSRVKPLVRDPKDIADLASYQLISGVTAGQQTQIQEG